jgi:polysaccharide biosynthesis/export protein
MLNCLISIPVSTLLIVLLSGCAPTASQMPPASATGQKPESATSVINSALATVAMNTSLPSADYRIGPEDLLKITLFNITDAGAGVTPRTVDVRVSQQGLISLPLLGDIKVAGLTPSGLERDLQKYYDKYIHSPQVGVMVAEYRQRVAVIGAVQKTGTVELTGPKTVIDILSMAGGVTDKAGTQVHIYRHGPNGRESQVIDLLVLASNASLINAGNAGLITTPVQSGDVINVPPQGTFFVDGAVRSPGAYALGRRYSLTQALATAGGINRDLYSADVTIFRRRAAASEIEPISVDLDAVVAGARVDPQIEADDVILVPISGYKYAYFRIVGTLLGWGTSIAGATTY